MKKIKITLVMLAAFMSLQSSAILTNFSMVWSFCTASGANQSAWNDVCLGGTVYMINKSIYFGNAPIPNVLTGNYKVYNDLTNVLIATIPASSWPYNGIVAVTVNAYFNYSSGLNYRVEYIGSDAVGIKQRVGYLSTHSPAVSAGPDVATCLTNAVVLTASGASSYVWSPSGSTAASIVVNPGITTTYGLTGTSTYVGLSQSTNQNVTCSATDQVKVTVNLPPISKGWVNTYNLCPTDIMPILSAYSGAGSFSFQWGYTPASGIPLGLPVTTYSVDSGVYGFGSYTVTVTNNVTGCTNTYVVNVNLIICRPTGVNELSETADGIAISPNPGQGIFEINDQSADHAAISRIEVRDMDGRLIKVSEGPVQLIDLTGQAAGIYLLHIVRGDNVVVKKLVVSGN